MNKSVEQHLEELIKYYENLDFYIFPPDYIQKLIVRNLKDVKRRYIKYDKDRITRINKAIEYIKDYLDSYVQPIYDKEVIEIYYEKIKELLAILGDKEWE